MDTPFLFRVHTTEIRLPRILGGASLETFNERLVFMVDSRQLGYVIFGSVLPICLPFYYFFVIGWASSPIVSNLFGMTVLTAVLLICAAFPIISKRFEFYEDHIDIFPTIFRRKKISVKYSGIVVHQKLRNTGSPFIQLSLVESGSTDKSWEIQDAKIRGLDMSVSIWIISKQQNGNTILPIDFEQRKKEHKPKLFQKLGAISGIAIMLMAIYVGSINGSPAQESLYSAYFIVIFLIGFAILLYFVISMRNLILGWTG
jgi:hypothetical protein